MSDFAKTQSSVSYRNYFFPSIGRSEAELLQNAKLLLKSGETSLAKRLLSYILSHDSHHLLAISLMAEALRIEGKREESILCYTQMLRIEETGSGHLRLASVYYELNQDDQALNHYYLGLEMGDHSHQELFNAYKNLGNIALRSGDYETAEEQYNRAFSICPESDTLLVNYGSLEVCRGNLSEAANRFRCAAMINSQNDKAWLGLAIVHRQFGDLALSWGNIEKALDLNPLNKLSLNLIADWALKDNRLIKIVPRLKHYLQFNDQDIEISLLLSKILFCMGDYFYANTELERLLQLEPASLEGWNLKKQIDEALEKIKLSNNTDWNSPKAYG